MLRKLVTGIIAVMLTLIIPTLAGCSLGQKAPDDEAPTQEQTQEQTEELESQTEELESQTEEPEIQTEELESQNDEQSEVDTSVDESSEASSNAEETADGDVLAGNPDVEGETEAQMVILEREQLAADFVRTWWSTSGYDPEDDTKVWVIDDWFEQTLAYVKPDSQLYYDFMNRESQESPGYFDAATIVKEVQVTGHEEDTYFVVATVAATQGARSGWSEQTYELTHEVTFDSQNWIVKLDQWG